MNKFFLVIIFGVCLSCSQRVEKKSKHILAESKMIEVLVEVHLLESAFQLNFLEVALIDSLNISDYYEALFECLKRLEDELEMPFRFIGSWCSEEYVLLEYYKNSGLSIPNFDWYLERVIPIIHNGQTFTSICDIWVKDVKDKYTISGDLPENFRMGYDEHPNQKLRGWREISEYEE